MIWYRKSNVMVCSIVARPEKLNKLSRRFTVQPEFTYPAGAHLTYWTLSETTPDIPSIIFRPLGPSPFTPFLSLILQLSCAIPPYPRCHIVANTAHFLPTKCEAYIWHFSRMSASQDNGPLAPMWWVGWHKKDYSIAASCGQEMVFQGNFNPECIAL